MEGDDLLFEIQETDLGKILRDNDGFHILSSGGPWACDQRNHTEWDMSKILARAESEPASGNTSQPDAAKLKPDIRIGGGRILASQFYDSEEHLTVQKERSTEEPHRRVRESDAADAHDAINSQRAKIQGAWEQREVQNRTQPVQVETLQRGSGESASKRVQQQEPMLKESVDSEGRMKGQEDHAPKCGGNCCVVQ